MFGSSQQDVTKNSEVRRKVWLQTKSAKVKNNTPNVSIWGGALIAAADAQNQS